uniref:Uncharacterized protein n=1 Tax=Opuntia streptacantha TaxID=393608 RepID=A0A7C9EXX4_OPUST
MAASPLSPCSLEGKNPSRAFSTKRAGSVALPSTTESCALQTSEWSFRFSMTNFRSPLESICSQNCVNSARGLTSTGLPSALSPILRGDFPCRASAVAFSLSIELLTLAGSKDSGL